MNIVVSQGNIQASEADTLIVNLFDDVTTPAGATGAVDQAMDGAISELIASGDLSGKAGEVGILYPRGLDWATGTGLTWKACGRPQPTASSRRTSTRRKM